MDTLFDFPLVENFIEVPDRNNYDIKTEGFVIMGNTILHRHLHSNGFNSYNSIPRSINEYHFLYSFKNNIHENAKAQIVSIYNSWHSKSTWVFMTVFNEKKNNYYALTFKVNEDLSGLTVTIKDIFEKTMKKGLLCSLFRYKFIADNSVCRL